MLLSSIERVKRFLCVESTPKNDRIITQYLYAVSAQIEAYLSTEFELKERVEDFNINNIEREFWLKAIPVQSISKVEHSFDGQFNGSEITVTDVYIGSGKRSFVLDLSESAGKRVLRATYTGGVASTTSLSTMGIASVSGTFLKDSYATGNTSGAYGIIKTSTGATSITLDVIAGAFTVGEVLTMQASENGEDTPGISATVSALTNQSLVELLPEVATATELQIAYNVRVKDQIEVLDVLKDGTKKRDSQNELTFRGAFQDIQPEVRSLINAHRRYSLQ